MLALLSRIFQFKKKLTAYYDNSKTDSVTNGDIL